MMKLANKTILMTFVVLTLSKLFSVFPEWKIPQEIKIEIDLRGIITRFYA